MEHWFDALTRPQTRRTAVRSAVVAGAALLLPIGRLPSARAEAAEPCYVPCLQLANAQQEVDDGACSKRFGTRSWAESAPFAGGLLTRLRNERWTGCNAVASCQWHEATVRCRFQPDCGDKTRYPGGAAPTPVPQPPPGG